MALAWVKSYLQGRKQFVRITDAVSFPSDLSIGVPQGSVLGPLLFLCYILPLRQIIERHGIHRHGYADDTQLYCPLTLGDNEALPLEKQKMEKCIDDMRSSVYANKLKINKSKTEVVVVARKADAPKAEGIRVRIGEAVVTSRRTVKNLGAIFDDQLTMKSQASDVARRANHHLRSISHIRAFLSQKACASAINATVTSRLDFHNGSLLGAPKSTLRKLTLVQNSAARVLTKTPTRQHITPVLAHLHWLPIEQRVEYKVLCLIHCGVHAVDSPTYLNEICTAYQPERTLRSGSRGQLVVNRVDNAYGARAFSQAGARLWNALPQALRELDSEVAFKKQLKTFLFRRTYHQIL